MPAGLSKGLWMEVMKYLFPKLFLDTISLLRMLRKLLALLTEHIFTTTRQKTNFHNYYIECQTVFL